MVANKKNVLVIGADSFHTKQLEKLAHKKKYQIDTSLGIEELKEAALKDKKEWKDYLQSIEQKVKKGAYDGVMAYWDFPSTLLRSYFVDKYSFPGASFLSTLKCEHKYWSRKLQKNLIAEYTPEFELIDLENTESIGAKKLSYPYWLKPIKSLSSQLAFKINNPEEEKNIIALLRKKKNPLANVFSFFVNQVNLPKDIPTDTSRYFLAEECLTGNQFTVEGYVFNGKVHGYAIFDNINDKSDCSFIGYEYPSQLTSDIKQSMIDISEKIMLGVGYNNAPFNIEFFYDQKTKRLVVLEINPRVSQSHTLPIQYVDNISNLEISCELALGQKPDELVRKGQFKYSGKFFIRAYSDGVVAGMPSSSTLSKLRKKFPGLKIKFPIDLGMKLSDLKEQDSYSFELALLYLGDKTHQALLDQYKEIKKHLNFQIVR
tara:strand:+ start:1236 stop:2525 length:1290 start_codon:yes stop_codon:yes gene_type:complete